MDNNNKSGNNFFSVFLLGVLVGAAVVFLLGTKKGKRLLKAISEEGAENISNILEKVDKSVNLDEVSETSEELNSQEEISIEKTKPKARRFFRGISRHLN